MKHLDVAGKPAIAVPIRRTVKKEVKRLNKELLDRGIGVELIETKLDEKEIAQSNLILFDGTPIEKLLGIEIKENYCRILLFLIGRGNLLQNRSL